MHRLRTILIILLPAQSLACSHPDAVHERAPQAAPDARPVGSTVPAPATPAAATSNAADAETRASAPAAVVTAGPPDGDHELGYGFDDLGSVALDLIKGEGDKTVAVGDYHEILIIPTAAEHKCAVRTSAAAGDPEAGWTATTIDTANIANQPGARASGVVQDFAAADAQFAVDAAGPFYSIPDTGAKMPVRASLGTPWLTPFGRRARVEGNFLRFQRVLKEAPNLPAQWVLADATLTDEGGLKMALSTGQAQKPVVQEFVSCSPVTIHIFGVKD